MRLQSISTLKYLLWGAVILVMLAVIFQPITYHVQSMTFVDDGFYYLGYAKNLASGQGATFDGLIYTNGVQPLWAILLVIVASLVQGELALMQAAMLLALVLLILSFFFMSQILKRFFTGAIYRLTCLFLLALIATPQLFLNGMESALILFTFSLALWKILRIQELSHRQHLIAGCLLSLVILSRIDLLIMTPTFALLLVWSNQTLQARDWKGMVQSVIGLAIPCLVVFGMYLAINLALFGLALPVSGMIKSVHYGQEIANSGGRFSLVHLIDTSRYTLIQLGVILNYYLTTLLLSYSKATLITRVLLVIGWLIVTFSLIIHRRKIIRDMRRIQLNRLPLIVALVIFANLVLHTWMEFFVTGPNNATYLSWYYVNWYVFLTIGLGFIAQQMANLFSIKAIERLNTILVILICVSLGLTLTTFNSVDGAKPLASHYQAALWANENIPADEIIGSYNSGVIGYFTDQSVINLDGLMNDDSLLQMVTEGGSMIDYFVKHNIQWLMEYDSSKNPQSQTVFRQLPTSLLDFVYDESFQNFGFQASIYYIAHVNLNS